MVSDPARRTTYPRPETVRRAWLLGAYRKMAQIRAFELEAARSYRAGIIPGFIHLSVGQEATAVGVCSALQAGDVVISNHRPHAHYLAMNLDPEALFAELMGRASGCCGGLAGSMHISNVTAGFYGANGIVAGGLPSALGAGFAFKRREQGNVVVAFFGDGAVAQGVFHETLNLAALWKLPIVLVCENNGYAEFSKVEDQHPVPIAQRAAGYGIEGFVVDGRDVEHVYDFTEELVAHVRSGVGPILVEAQVDRLSGHFEGDPAHYRSSDEELGPDPLQIAGESLLTRGIAEHDLADVRRVEEAAVHQAALQAAGAPYPVWRADFFVYAPHERVVDDPSPEREDDLPNDEPYRYVDAVNDAIAFELEHDSDAFLAGVDVSAGGPFGATKGLASRFPGQVISTPISEAALIGLGIGSALAGLRPIVEIMFEDLIGVCFDQIVNQMAKMRFMSGGHTNLPIVLRTQYGSGRSAGAQHSQSLEGVLAHIPGLKVALPSCAADAYGLIRAAFADPNPVVILEHRHLYYERGTRPPRDHIVPLGKAKLLRQGSDLTIVSWGRMATVAVDTARRLAGRIDIEVVDLRSLVPLDAEAILTSVQHTGRLMVLHEASLAFGPGAEIAAMAAERGFWSLDVPCRRLGAMDTPAPYSPALETQWIPDGAVITRAIEELVRS